MKTNLHTLLTLSALALTSTLSARQLTPAEAYARLPKDATQHTNTIGTPDALLTIEANGRSALYFFPLGNDSYAIASADDNAPAMPGYFTATDLNHMPPAMSAMLDAYALTIVTQSQATLLSECEPIRPLIKTSWDQESPYNEMCPMDGDVHAMTGCVATAMAQVMNYYRWPEKPTGTVTYLDGDQYAQLDLSQYTFEWDLMLNSYKRNPSQAQIDAVATLMYAAGRSVNMEYYASASWATEMDAAKALINNFDYAKSIYLATPEFYSTDQWSDLMYDEVKQGRPVIFSGSSLTGGGHTFILDGVDSQNRYHINWGWGGDFNGYFAIDALNPTGVQENGYNWYQTAVCGITADHDTPDAIFIVTRGTRLRASVSSTKVTFTPISFIGLEEDMMNRAFVQCSGYFGLRLSPVDGGEDIIVRGTTYASFIPFWNNVSSFDVNLSSLPTGRYTVYPVFITNDNWADVHMTDDDPRTLMMNNDGNGDVTFELTNYSSVQTVSADTDGDKPLYDLRGVRVTTPRPNTIYVTPDGTRLHTVR